MTARKISKHIIHRNISKGQSLSFWGLRQSRPVTVNCAHDRTRRTRAEGQLQRGLLFLVVGFHRYLHVSCCLMDSRTIRLVHTTQKILDCPPVPNASSIHAPACHPSRLLNAPAHHTPTPFHQKTQSTWKKNSIMLYQEKHLRDHAWHTDQNLTTAAQPTTTASSLGTRRLSVDDAYPPQEGKNTIGRPPQERRAGQKAKADPNRSVNRREKKNTRVVVSTAAVQATQTTAEQRSTEARRQQRSW